MSSKPWTEADREPIAVLVRGLLQPGLIELAMTPDQFADLVLDALTAADWQRDATAARERIAAALADIDRVELLPMRTHSDSCWRWHAGCLAARIRRTLTEEDPNAR